MRILGLGASHGVLFLIVAIMTRNNTMARRHINPMFLASKILGLDHPKQRLFRMDLIVQVTSMHMARIMVDHGLEADFADEVEDEEAEDLVEHEVGDASILTPWRDHGAHLPR